MATFTDIFERKEIKYRISAAQFQRVQQELSSRMQPDAYGRSAVSSLYYDTPNFNLINRSLEKPVYKEKLRLRSYGAPVDTTLAQPAFLEIKKKFKGIVYKRRVHITAQAAQAFLDGMPYEQAVAAFPLEDAEAQETSLSARSLQISKEIAYFNSFYGPLAPAMRIDVMRTAWCMQPEQEDDVRVTFDEDICYTNLLAANPRTTPLLPDGDVIMEVKICGAMPMWLVQILDSCVIKPSSFSKYGESYKATLAS